MQCKISKWIGGSNLYDPNVLVHHGVKGMKWGVRRTKEQLGHMNHARNSKEVFKDLDSQNRSYSEIPYGKDVARRSYQARRLMSEVDNDPAFSELATLSKAYKNKFKKHDALSGIHDAIVSYTNLGENTMNSVRYNPDGGYSAWTRSRAYHNMVDLIDNPATGKLLTSKRGKGWAGDLRKRSAIADAESDIVERWDEVSSRLINHGPVDKKQISKELDEINNELKALKLDYPGMDKVYKHHDEMIERLKRDDPKLDPYDVKMYEYPMVDITKESVDVMSDLYDNYLTKLDNPRTRKRLQNG